MGRPWRGDVQRVLFVECVESIEQISPFRAEVTVNLPGSRVPRRSVFFDLKRHLGEEVLVQLFQVDGAGEEDQVVTHPREGQLVDPIEVWRRQLQ